MLVHSWPFGRLFLAANLIFLQILFLSKINPNHGYSFVSYKCCNRQKEISREQKDAERIQSIVNKCYQSPCRHWILECHWFCDAVRGLREHDRCIECLKMRGMSCYECFDM